MTSRRLKRSVLLLSFIIFFIFLVSHAVTRFLFECTSRPNWRTAGCGTHSVRISDLHPCSPHVIKGAPPSLHAHMPCLCSLDLRTTILIVFIIYYILLFLFFLVIEFEKWTQGLLVKPKEETCSLKHSGLLTPAQDEGLIR